MDGQSDNGACLYYKLTYESEGSGELKKSTLSDEKKSALSIQRSLFLQIKFSC